MDILEKILGGTARVRLMRVFLFNLDDVYDAEMLTKRVGVSLSITKRELRVLSSSGFLKKKEFEKMVEKGSGRNKKNYKRKASGFCLNNSFPYVIPLQKLLTETSSLQEGSLIKRISQTGKIKLVIVSGIFIQNTDSRIDLLIVGDKFNKNLFDKVIKSIEMDVGKELKYAVFETADFRYRLNVYDKLVRDVLDYPHEKIMNKFGLV